MNITVIRRLAETFDESSLLRAEADILDGNEPLIEVPGDDEGDKLTHVIGALWVTQRISSTGSDTIQALREYARKIRTSITSS